MARGIRKRKLTRVEFLEFVDAAKLQDGCVELDRNVTKDGYPHFWDKQTKRKLRANRLVLEHKLGRPIKPGMLACHTCNNRRCIQMSHIYEGTKSTNLYDSIEAGTHRWGRGKAAING